MNLTNHTEEELKIEYVIEASNEVYPQNVSRADLNKILADE